MPVMAHGYIVICAWIFLYWQYNALLFWKQTMTTTFCQNVTIFVCPIKYQVLGINNTYSKQSFKCYKKAQLSHFSSYFTNNQLNMNNMETKRQK